MDEAYHVPFQESTDVYENLKHKYQSALFFFVVKIYCIKVYLTRPQYEKLKEVKGMQTISEYVQRRITGNALFLEQKITENNTILKRLEEHLLKRNHF